jgi:hypothetical protein
MTILTTVPKAKDIIRDKVILIISDTLLILPDDLEGKTKLITELEVDETDWLTISNEIATKFLLMPESLAQIEKLEDRTIDDIVDVIFDQNI